MYTIREYTPITHIIEKHGRPFASAWSREEAEHIVAALNEYNQPKDCGHCGIPVKREDMITGAYGGTFCCEQHRRAYDKE